MWERFSYYGMRALLVLSLIAGVEATNPGFGWSQSEALKLYGLFTASCTYALIGGWLADNYLGQRKSVIIGGLLMASASSRSRRDPRQPRPVLHRPRDPGAGNASSSPNLDHGRRPVAEATPAATARSPSSTWHQRRCIPRALVCSTWRGSAYGCAPAISPRASAWCCRDHPAAVRAPLPREIAPCRPQSARSSSRAQARPAHRRRGGPLRVIFMLFVFVVLFWARSSRRRPDEHLRQRQDRPHDRWLRVPAGWFQSLNRCSSSCSLRSSPHVGQAPRSQEPGTPRKMCWTGADRHRLPGDGGRGLESAAAARPRCRGW